MAIDLNELRDQVRGSSGRRAAEIVQERPQEPPRVVQPTRVVQVPPRAQPPRQGTSGGVVLAIVGAVLIGLYAASGPTASRKSTDAVVAQTPVTPTAPNKVVARAPKNAPVTQGSQSTFSVAPASTPSDQKSLIDRVIESNRAGILSVLALTASAEDLAVERAAVEAGRSAEIGDSVTRDRKSARALNKEALAAFYREELDLAYELGSRAFAADPIDVEIAGNLAIFALRTNKIAESERLALYALSVPRGATKTGRTADWNTLAAAYAAQSREEQAKQALYVTLAIAPDLQRRCVSATHSVRSTYGPVLREATEAMFLRIRDRNLPSFSECALPIQW